MREIKFRGLCAATNNWVYGGFFINSAGDCIIVEPNDWKPSYSDPDSGGSVNFVVVDPESVGQYTGLKDCNGVDIFEGDIVESSVHTDIPLHHVIEWSDKYNGWFVRNTTATHEHDGSIQLFVYKKNYQFGVIGNVHENQELLENNK